MFSAQCSAASQPASQSVQPSAVRGQTAVERGQSPAQQLQSAQPFFVFFPSRALLPDESDRVILSGTLPCDFQHFTQFTFAKADNSYQFNSNMFNSGFRQAIEFV